MKNIKNTKGFTLIELIVAMGIVGILALIIIPNFDSIFKSTHSSTKDANARAYYSETYKSMDQSVSNGQQFLTMDQITTIKDKFGLDVLQVKYIKSNGRRNVNAIWYKKGNIEGYYPSKKAYDETLEEVPDTPSPDRPIGPDPIPKPEPTPDPEPDPIVPEKPGDPGFNINNYSHWGETWWYTAGSVVQIDGALYTNWKGEDCNPGDPSQNRPDELSGSWTLLRRDLFVEWDSSKSYPAGTLVIYNNDRRITNQDLSGVALKGEYVVSISLGIDEMN
ncbi:MAG: type II secretion system protein [Erysipelotrichaceae bacterium]